MVRSILKSQFYPIIKRTSGSLKSSMIGRPHSISAMLNKKQILKKKNYLTIRSFQSLWYSWYGKPVPNPHVLLKVTILIVYRKHSCERSQNRQELEYTYHVTIGIFL